MVIRGSIDRIRSLVPASGGSYLLGRRLPPPGEYRLHTPSPRMRSAMTGYGGLAASLLGSPALHVARPSTTTGVQSAITVSAACAYCLLPILSIPKPKVCFVLPLSQFIYMPIASLLLDQ
jgi:hypothetical protein